MLRLIITGVLFSILLTGCNPSEKKDTTSSEDGEYNDYEKTPSESESSGEPKVHTVEIAQMKFEPAVLNVRKGDKIIWINKDLVDHDITDQNKTWASSKLPGGASWNMVVTKSEAYYCNLHVVMKGKIIVDGADIALLDAAPGITMCKSSN